MCFWFRLCFVREREVPSREYVAKNLLIESQWITADDVYSYIALPNRRENETCFFSANHLRQFLERHNANTHEQKWSAWEVESPFNVDEKTIMVKSRTGRV
jgi:hypothetical protein